MYKLITVGKLTDGPSLPVTNSPKLSSLTQRITSSTPTALAHMLPSDNSTMRLKMQTRLLKSSQSGQKAGAVRVLPSTVKAILWEQKMRTMQH